jgi:replicative DNA helicase
MRILREKCIAREAVAVARELEEAALDPAGAPGLESRVQQALVKIAGMFETRAKTQSMAELVAAALERYEAANRKGGGITGLATGILPFDKATRGLKAGEMITVSAQTKDGKSAFAVNIAAHNALAGIPVGIFSLEMSADEITDRLFPPPRRLTSRA